MGYRLKGDEATEFGTDLVVYESAHSNVIDAIETEVNEALKLISGIEGIDKIDECKEKLESLSRDLY